MKLTYGKMSLVNIHEYIYIISRVHKEFIVIYPKHIYVAQVFHAEITPVETSQIQIVELKKTGHLITDFFSRKTTETERIHSKFEDNFHSETCTEGKYMK